MAVDEMENKRDTKTSGNKTFLPPVDVYYRASSEVVLSPARLAKLQSQLELDLRNRRDGAVEAVFQGEDRTVDAMVEACSAGPRFAQVGRVEVFEDAEPAEAGFRVLPTV